MKYTGKLTRAAVCISLLTISACASSKRIATDWAVPGATSRLTVKERLGEPAEYYENGRILAYRLSRRNREFGRFDEDLTLVPPGSAYTNLIFTFDDAGKLLNVSRVGLQD